MMSLLQLGAVFAVLLIMLAGIGVLLVRARSRSRKPQETPPEKAPDVEPAPLQSGRQPTVQPAVQARKRRLVTDMKISHDPVVAQGGPATPFTSFAEVEQRLERALNELESGEITLDTYRLRVKQEEARLLVDLGRLSTNEYEQQVPEFEDARRAMALIKYCLEWAQANG